MGYGRKGGRERRGRGKRGGWIERKGGKDGRERRGRGKIGRNGDR